MKMKKLFAICLVALSALISVHLQAQEVETLVLIDTDMGKIKVKLFNDTPQHRDNFIKNVKEHRYDGLLFHRVIKQFMVQAGDINSKDAPMEQHLGDGDLDYTIPAEIVYPKYFHKRGMFAAARTGDKPEAQQHHRHNKRRRPFHMPIERRYSRLFAAHSSGESPIEG